MQVVKPCYFPGHPCSCWTSLGISSQRSQGGSPSPSSTCTCRTTKLAPCLPMPLTPHPTSRGSFSGRRSPGARPGSSGVVKALGNSVQVEVSVQIQAVHMGIIDVTVARRDPREHLPNLQLGKRRPREHRYAVSTAGWAVPGLQTQDSRCSGALTGLWGFRIIQGAQLPKEMGSFPTAEPGWFLPTSPPSIP